MTLSKQLAAGSLIAALSAGAALPAISEASAAPNVKQTSTYAVTVNKGVLASGGRTVKAKAVVTNPQRNVSDWYSRSTIQKVVRKAANQGIERPFDYQGYRCTPVLSGGAKAPVAHFTCKLNGGDVPTTVKLTFAIPFKAVKA
jgi:PKD repeat protein